MIVLDASAILAFLRAEPGSDTVEQALLDGAACGAANWSEVAQKSLQSATGWSAARRLLEAYDLVVEPVTKADADWAAAFWQTHPTLSLADRLCLALGNRLGATVLTADAAWGNADPIRQIR